MILVDYFRKAYISSRQSQKNKYSLAASLLSCPAAKYVAFTLAEGATHVAHCNNLRKVAFTLAEVLITLGIIGVVAALTLPSVIQKMEDQRFVSSLKKTYSILSQATNSVIAEHENPEYWWIEDDQEEPVKQIYEYYKPYFNAMRMCPNTAGCWGYPTKYLNGNVYWESFNRSWYQYTYTLVDGVSVLIDIYDASNVRLFGVDVDYPCPVFWVDLNSGNLPNQIGRDVFAFLITKKGLQPAGLNDTTTCNKNGTGWSCTSRIIQDGWTIKYLK